MKHAGVSITGRLREVNEDAWGVARAANLFAVADGCGGAGPGLNAAEIAIQCVLRAPQTAGAEASRSPMDPLAKAILDANSQILSAAVGPKRGMGSAIAALRLDEGWASVVSIGDCRVYRYRRGYSSSLPGVDARGGRLSAMTIDDELWLAMIRDGATTEEALDALKNHPNVIVVALGTSPRIPVEVQYEEVVEGDLFLLCTDGLTRQLDHRNIREVIADGSASLARRCEELAKQADARHGADNVTVVLVQA